MYPRTVQGMVLSVELLCHGVLLAVVQGEPMTNEEVLFTTVAGGTGVGITVSLILMVSTASEQIRYPQTGVATARGVLHGKAREARGGQGAQ